jgi:hypothetical protein
MLGVDTSSPAAKMVKFQAIRDWSDEEDVGYSVCEGDSSELPTTTDAPVPAVIEASCPDPTRAQLRPIFRDRPILVDLVPESTG